MEGGFVIGIQPDSFAGGTGPLSGVGVGENLEVVDNNLKVKNFISNIDKLAFNLTAGQTASVGEFTWNATEETLDLGLPSGTLQLGSELGHLVKHADNIGLIDGYAVYAVGSSGDNVLVRYAQANLESTSSKTFGVMTNSSIGGQKARMVTEGVVHNIDTHLLTEGAIVWLSPTDPGMMTTTKPTAPNHTVMMGLCLRQHAVVGSIFVRITNGFELDELHDVSIVTPTTGQVLQFDNGLWKNKTVAGVGAANHDDLVGLQGGTSGEHYHLTAAELQAVQELDMQLARKIDFDGDYIYKGEAYPGTALTDTTWRISRTYLNPDDGDVTVLWADGNANFDNIWSNHLVLTYS